MREERKKVLKSYFFWHRKYLKTTPLERSRKILPVTVFNFSIINVLTDLRDSLGGLNSQKVRLTSLGKYSGRGSNYLICLPSPSNGRLFRALQFCSHPLLACPTFVPLQNFMYISKNNFSITNLKTWRDRACNFELKPQIKSICSNPFRCSKVFPGAGHWVWTEL